MRRRALALVPMFVGLVGAVLIGMGGTSYANHLGIPHNADGQTFLPDALACRASTSNLTGSETTVSFPSSDTCAAETLGANAATDVVQDIMLPKGNKLGLPMTYYDGAFQIGNDASIANGTQVGGVIAAINIGCDDTTDFFLDSSSTAPYGLSGGTDVPEQLNEQTTAWGPGTGFGGKDESFLDNVLPPPPLFSPVVRYRADVNFVSLGTSAPVPLSVPTSLNVVTMQPSWGNSTVALTTLGGDASAPSGQLTLCLDSPQTSKTILNGAAGGLKNPTLAGLYAAWTVQVSAAGIRDEQSEQASLITSCKQIGGAVVDADNDCWADSADTNTGNADQDGDGIPDGIEVSWLGTAACPNGGASPVNTADCDGDGRTDLEELLEPPSALTNPRVADSDSDGKLDAGLNYDCNGDGTPDSVVSSTSAGAGTGRNRKIFDVMYCKPDGTSTNSSGIGGRPTGNVGALSEDNCPSNPNPTQANSANTDVELGTPDGDSNGRFGGTADVTHAYGRLEGDACVSDADGDGVADTVENAPYNFDATGGASGDVFCNNSGLGVAISTDPSNPDTDGDGSIDGVECQLGKNPDDATSKPGTTLNSTQQVYYRLTQLTQPGGPFLINLDDGSTIAGVPETKGGGAGAAASNDLDRDGCPDETEATDTDGNRTAADADRLAIARAVLLKGAWLPPAPAPTAEEIRTGDLDHNGALGDADRLAAARIVLSGAIASVPDYNLNCKAAGIGYDAN